MAYVSPLANSPSFSNQGAKALQCPHQGAQNSTKTQGCQLRKEVKLVSSRSTTWECATARVSSSRATTFNIVLLLYTQDIISTFQFSHQQATHSYVFRQIDNKSKLLIKQQNSMYADQNDQYSEDELEHSNNPRAKVKPLNLTEKELRERLLTLKNYTIWKKTKAKRINYKELVGDEASPIIHTAASYGSRYGKNQVFIQFIQQHQSQNNNSTSHTNKNFDSQAAREAKSVPKEKPSFLNYKADEKQKQKIYRMINRIPKLSPGELSVRKKRASTQPRLNKQSKATPYPRQLAKLKDKLRILPLLGKQKGELQTNPQEQNVTMSLGSKQQSQAINIAVPFKYSSSKLSNNNHSFVYSDNSRSSYLKNIHSILSKSSELLNGVGSQSGFIRVSSSSYNSQKGSQSEYLQPSNSKPKYLYYWPKYSKYGVSEGDKAKLERILKKCGQINTEAIIENEDIKEMTSLIKQQIGQQQLEMDREVLEEEKNAFEHKFDYKISLEQEKYKRNMKELMRCKKEYRIEKQREEIRANGIKRMKKFREVDTRKFKMTQTELKEED